MHWGLCMREEASFCLGASGSHWGSECGCSRLFPRVFVWAVVTWWFHWRLSLGFRYELRIRYLPKGYLSHFSEDKPSLNYLYHQVSRATQWFFLVRLLWRLSDPPHTLCIPWKDVCVIYRRQNPARSSYCWLHGDVFLKAVLCFCRWRVTTCNI